MKQKNILVLSKYASRGEEGLESRLFRLCLEMTKKNIQIEFFTSNANHLAKYSKRKTSRHVVNENFKYTIINTYPYKKSYSLSRIISWIDFELKSFFHLSSLKSKPDIIWVSSLSFLSIINGVLYKKLYNKKLILEIRDIWPLSLIEYNALRENGIVHRLLQKVEYLGYYHADIILGTMPNLKQHIRDTLGKNKRVYHVPSGVDKPTDNPSNIPDELRLHPKKRAIRLGYAGSIGTANQLETLIETIYRFKYTHLIEFYFLGSGDLKELYQKRLQKFDNVFFLDRVDKIYVPFFLNQCDVLYLGTRNSHLWEYGWSLNKINDYMLAEKPILCSYSGHKSMINEANCGFFVPAEDSISLHHKLIEICNLEPNELIKMGKRGKKWILTHRNWEEIATSCIQIFFE